MSTDQTAPEQPRANSGNPQDIVSILFGLEGRVRRRVYIAWCVFCWAVLIGATIVTDNINPYSVDQTSYWITVLVLLWPSIAIAVKRWHDRGKSGAWVFLSLVPAIGPIWTVFELALLPGQPGDNAYGPSTGYKATKRIKELSSGERKEAAWWGLGIGVAACLLLNTPMDYDDSLIREVVDGFTRSRNETIGVIAVNIALILLVWFCRVPMGHFLLNVIIPGAKNAIGKAIQKV